MEPYRPRRTDALTDIAERRTGQSRGHSVMTPITDHNAARLRRFGSIKRNFRPVLSSHQSLSAFPNALHYLRDRLGPGQFGGLPCPDLHSLRVALFLGR